jgi:hypothetical protein
MSKRNSTTPILDAKIRFWSYTKTAKPSECWLYTGDKDSNGYGRVSIAGKKMRTHRFSYMIQNNLQPEDIVGLHIRHTCDNPSCVNPNHLLPGVAADNMQDKVDRDRQQRGENVNGARLTEKLVRHIRVLYESNIWNQTELAVMYGVSLGTINDAILRKTWKHVT